MTFNIYLSVFKFKIVIVINYYDNQIQKFKNKLIDINLEDEEDVNSYLLNKINSILKTIENMFPCKSITIIAKNFVKIRNNEVNQYFKV